METMKKKNKSYTATCPFLHLQKCISNNPLMETIKKKNKSYTATCPFSIRSEERRVGKECRL